MTMARAVREVQAATRAGRDRRDRRRPAAGHGQAALGDPRAADPHHLGRLLDHGLHAAGGHRRAAGAAGRAGAGDLRRRRLPPDDAGARGRGDARHAGLHGRPRQLGLDQHQGRAAGALRPHRRHRLPARRRAVLARLRRHRSRLRHPRRVRRAPGRGATGGRARAGVGRPVARPRRASTATWPWPDPTRPAGGTCRCPRAGPSTTSSCAVARRSSTDEPARLADRLRADRLEQRRPARPRAAETAGRRRCSTRSRASGSTGTQFGRGFPEGDELREALARRGLRFAELYSALPVDRDGLARRRARRRAARPGAAGRGRRRGAGASPSTAAASATRWSGRVADGAPRWPDAAFDALAALLGELAAAAPDGVRVAFHPHTATWVEAPDEVDALRGARCRAPAPGCAWTSAITSSAAATRSTPSGATDR